MALDLLQYSNLKDYFALPENINLTRNTRAKIFIQRCPNTNFFCSSFSIPDMSIQPVEIGTSSIKTINEPGEQFMISPFSFNLLIDEDFEAYLELVRWFQYTVRNGEVPESYSNALAIIYNSELIPIISIRFFNLYPITIGQLDFNVSEDEQMMIPIQMMFLDIEIEKVGTGERLFQDLGEREFIQKGTSWNRP
jgi:hypothetical protein